MSGRSGRGSTPVDELLAGLHGRGEVDLVADFAYALPMRIIAELVEVPEAERPRF